MLNHSSRYWLLCSLQIASETSLPSRPIALFKDKASLTECDTFESRHMSHVISFKFLGQQKLHLLVSGAFVLTTQPTSSFASTDYTGTDLITSSSIEREAILLLFARFPHFSHSPGLIPGFLGLRSSRFTQDLSIHVQELEH